MLDKPCHGAGCPRPIAKQLGRVYYCEKHYDAHNIPLLKKYTTIDEHLHWDQPLGVGRFESPASDYPTGWDQLQCDECNASWIGKRFPAPLCPFCISRGKHHATS